MNKKNNFITVLLSYSMLLLISAGCDNTIDGFDEEGGVETFSVFGYLDVSENINYIRVKDLNAPLVSGANATIDAEVTLLNDDTGASEQLEDSVVVFEGIATHNFRSTMDITPETTYLLRIENSKGEVRIAEATTPVQAEVTIQPESEFTCNSVIRVTLSPVRSNELVLTTLRFFVQGEVFEAASTVQRIENGARITFQPGTVVSEKTLNELDCISDEVSRFELDYTHLGPGYEEIFNDFGGLGTEQFIGLFDDTLVFPISHEE